MMPVIAALLATLAVVRVVAFWLAIVAAVIALLDWAVRTRRIGPFTPIARFCRRYIDPLYAPIEARVVRMGGRPASAPWWALAAVVLASLAVIGFLQFVIGLATQLAQASTMPSVWPRLLIAWAFGILKLALIVRVIASWFSISPWSRWVRWSYVLTDWMLTPLRRVIPPFGMMDVTPIVAYFAISIVQALILRI